MQKQTLLQQVVLYHLTIVQTLGNREFRLKEFVLNRAAYNRRNPKHKTNSDRLHSFKFPADSPDGVVFMCPNARNPHPGISVSKKSRMPWLPCCYKTPHWNQLTSKFRDYMRAVVGLDFVAGPSDQAQKRYKDKYVLITEGLVGDVPPNILSMLDLVVGFHTADRTFRRYGPEYGDKAFLACILQAVRPAEYRAHPRPAEDRVCAHAAGK